MGGVAADSGLICSSLTALLLPPGEAAPLAVSCCCPRARRVAAAASFESVILAGVVVIRPCVIECGAEKGNCACGGLQNNKCRINTTCKTLYLYYSYVMHTCTETKDYDERGMLEMAEGPQHSRACQALELEVQWDSSTAWL